MQFKHQLVAHADNGQADAVSNTAVFDQACEQVEQLGLTLAEAKALLRATQQAILQQQTTAFLRARTTCPSCHKQLATDAVDASRRTSAAPDPDERTQWRAWCKLQSVVSRPRTTGALSRRVAPGF